MSAGEEVTAELVLDDGWGAWGASTLGEHCHGGLVMEFFRRGVGGGAMGNETLRIK